eukprot:g3772.t1
MDEEELLGVVIPTTQAAFSDLISKPRLSEKLLKKPPFRFLHDIISNVTANTGFGEGLYEGDELNGKLIKGKGPKIAYLNKTIFAVGLALGRPCDVNPNKVVAGKQPERTNSFLQDLAKAAKEHASESSELVERVLAGETPGDSGPRPMKQSTRETERKEEKEEPLSRQPEPEPEPSSQQESKREPEPEPEHERRRREREPEPDPEPERDRESDRRDEEREKEFDRREMERETKDALDSKESEQEASSSSKYSEPDPTPTPTSSSSSSGRGGAVDVSSCNGDLDETAARISSVISKPKMQEKLLNKPPFRFLHDIIMNISAATGYQSNLYFGEELNSRAIKGKGPKIAFLQKILDAVNSDIGFECDINLNKVVAGKQPEKTRRFLEYLVAVATGSSGGSGGNDSGGGGRGESHQASSARMSSSPSRVNKREEKFEEKDSRLDIDTKTGGAMEFEAAKERPRTQRLLRPTTARRRPPTVRENVRKVASVKDYDPDAEVGNVMMEGEKDSDSDDDEEKKDGEDDDLVFGSAFGDVDDGGNKSKLVREIEEEEAKKRGEMESKDGKGGRKRKDGRSKKSGIRMGRVGKKANSVTVVDVRKLRIGIQKLCQSTNPLGKCMDYVHEDMDAMKKELVQWRNEYEKYTTEVEEIERDQEEETQALQQELLDHEEKIKVQIEKINRVKAQIARNDVRIEELLQMVVN